MEQHVDIHMEIERMSNQYLSLAKEILELQNKKFVLSRELVKMLAEHMPEVLKVDTNKLARVFGVPE